MLNRRGRREFLRGARGMLAALGVASQFPAEGAAKGHPASADAGADYYDKLGVTKIINAAGTYTALTASTMPPSVRAAVAAAAQHPVRLAELQKNAGEYLAQKLKSE